MIKLKKLDISTIRELGEKNTNKKDILDILKLKCTFNFNEKYKKNNRFFLDDKMLVNFIREKNLRIRSIHHRLYKENITINHSKISVNYNKKCYLFNGSYKTLQFDYMGAKIGFQYENNCNIDIYIDNMSWIDIFIDKKLNEKYRENLHISLVKKEGSKNEK